MKNWAKIRAEKRGKKYVHPNTKKKTKEEIREEENKAMEYWNRECGGLPLD